MANRKTADIYVTELQQENKKLHVMAYVMIALLVLVLAVSFTRQFVLVTVLLLIAILYQIFILRKAQKRYMKKCEDTNLELTVMPLISADHIEEKGTSLDKTEILEAGLIPAVDKTISVFKTISGTKDKMQVVSGDISLVEHKAESGVAAEVNTGNWIHIKLPKSTGYNFRISEDQLFPESLRAGFYDGQDLIETAGPDHFPDTLHIYTASGDTANALNAGDVAKLPSAAFFRKVQTLAGYTPGKLGISVRGDAMDVYIRNRFLGSSFSVRDQVDRNRLLANPYPELGHVLELTEFLLG